MANYHSSCGVDLSTICALTRTRRLVLLKEPPEAIAAFIWLLRREMPTCVHVRRAQAIAWNHFTCRDPDEALADEAGIPRHRLPRIRVLVDAVLKYLVRRGELHLHNKHYYWPEYDYLNAERGDARKRRRGPADHDDPDLDTPDPDLGPAEGPILSLRPPLPDRRGQ